jgi:hypothetical protein
MWGAHMPDYIPTPNTTNYIIVSIKETLLVCIYYIKMAFSTPKLIYMQKGKIAIIG